MEGYLTWEAPEGGLSIFVHRSVLKDLKLFAEDAFSGAYVETGGLLTGCSEDRIEPGGRVVTIENFERGVSRLHDQDVVGFVRCRRQTSLHLNESDFLALRSGLGLVALMIRPDGNAGAVGGFFYREGRMVQCPPARMQFPIDGAARDCPDLPVATAQDTDPAAPATARRVVYATIGLALMLSSFAIWLMGR